MIHSKWVISVIFVIADSGHLVFARATSPYLY